METVAGVLGENPGFLTNLTPKRRSKKQEGNFNQQNYTRKRRGMMLSALAFEALTGAPSLHRTGDRSWSKKHVLISLGQSVVWLIIISGLVWQASFSCQGLGVVLILVTDVYPGACCSWNPADCNDSMQRKQVQTGVIIPKFCSGF